MEQGIMIAADRNLQTLIPIWHGYYQQVMNLPVAFVDFGVDEAYAAYCRRHFHYICLEDEGKNDQTTPKELADIWKSLMPNHSKRREAWFKKLLACQLTPFQRTLWLDVDCAVLKPINELFDYPEEVLGLVAEDEKFQLSLHVSGLTAFDEMTYNSGVILFDRFNPLIQQWSERAKKESHLFMGDQDLLSRIIYETGGQVERLPSIYNHLVRLKRQKGIKILHYAGLAKVKMYRDLVEKLNKGGHGTRRHDCS